MGVGCCFVDVGLYDPYNFELTVGQDRAKVLMSDSARVAESGTSCAIKKSG